MVTRIFDASVLNAQGALIDVVGLVRQRGSLAADRANNSLSQKRMLFLRWQTAPSAGLPSEPFKVWRRPALPLGEHKQVEFEVLRLLPMIEIIQFETPLASVSLTVRSDSGGTVSVAVLCGPPTMDAIVTIQSRTLSANESAQMEFQAPCISGLALLNVSRFDHVSGMSVEELDKIQNWELIETVGLPVDEGEWSALGQRHGVKQGLVGAELSAFDAAVDRFKRGVNPLGWWPAFPDGAPALAWDMPDPAKLVEESALELLPMLKQAAQAAPDQQAARLFQFAIDPPQNPAGDTMPTGQQGKADLSPIGLLAMAASSDPMLAVTLGYGTGYPDENLPTINLSNRSYFSDANRSYFDWMITGLWEKGLDGASDAVEFAAIVPRPALGLPAPTPSDQAVDFQAHLPPSQVDHPWLGSIRTSWERFPSTQLASVASFAAARRQNGATGNGEALLQNRLLTQGFRPIGNVLNPRDPEPTRQSATDGALPIPNDPGSIAMSYAAATQNIFGIWSPWAVGTITVEQPAPAHVQILSAELDPVDIGTGTLCPAVLTFEISVDWKVRSVDRVELRGKLFASATRHDDTPGGPPPTGLEKKLGDIAQIAHIQFSGHVPSIAGGTVESLNSEGSATVTPGPTGQSSSRRYRVTIPGFSLDYASTPHIGVKLEARLIERIAPKRVGDWSIVPKVTYASDPRSRPSTVVDLVRVASLPDAGGECHAHIDWAPVPGAIGYALYESTETRILSSHDGFPEPTPDRTLSQRLTTIKQAFAEAPLRRDFTRRNANLLTTTSVDVTLPRGSRDIHLYTVLPVMAGGNEGPWPSGPDADKALIPYVAPRVAEPAPPTIEVQLAQDKSPAPPNYRARLRIGTRGGAGARPKRIDIYRVRVDDAARQLDSMGPPIATLSASSGNWTISSPSSGGDWIDTVTGIDQPSGSWRNVWYRAVAWSEDDPQRAVLKGRSLPSPAVSVLVPPPGPPDLSPLTVSWPGGDPAAVLLSFSSVAPISRTPIGPHKLSIEARVVGGLPMIQSVTALDQLETAQPADGSGAWRESGTPTPYCVLLRRASVNDAVSVIVRITDPLGRASEQTISIPGGSVLPMPILSAIDAFTISGRGKAFSFSTDAPDNDGMGGIYRLHIELVPTDDASPFRKPLPTPGPLRPGRPTASQFRVVNGVYVFDGPLSSVRRVTAVIGSGTDALTVGRQKPPLDDNFGIFAQLKLKSVLVRIVTPDGRSVEQRRRG